MCSKISKDAAHGALSYTASGEAPLAEVLTLRMLVLSFGFRPGADSSSSYADIDDLNFSCAMRTRDHLGHSDIAGGAEVRRATPVAQDQDPSPEMAGKSNGEMSGALLEAAAPGSGGQRRPRETPRFHHNVDA